MNAQEIIADARIRELESERREFKTLIRMCLQQFEFQYGKRQRGWDAKFLMDRCEALVGVQAEDAAIDSSSAFADYLPLSPARIAPGEYAIKDRTGRTLWTMNGAALADWVCQSVNGYDGAVASMHCASEMFAPTYEPRICSKCGHEERFSDNEGGRCEKIVDEESNFCGCVCNFAGTPSLEDYSGDAHELGACGGDCRDCQAERAEEREDRGLENLYNELAESVLTAPIEDLEEEIRAEGRDPDKVAEEVREVMKSAVRKCSGLK